MANRQPTSPSPSPEQHDHHLQHRRARVDYDSNNQNGRTRHIDLRPNNSGPLPPSPVPAARNNTTSLPPIEGLPKTVKEGAGLIKRQPANETRQAHKALPRRHSRQTTLTKLQALLSTASNGWPVGDNNTNSGYKMSKPKDIVRRNGISPLSSKKNHAATTLPPLVPSASSRDQNAVKQKIARRSSASKSRIPSIDEENDMWSKLAIIENSIDQMEEGWKAQDYNRRSNHNYHLPVLSLTDDLTTVPKPWPINLIVVHTEKKKRPGSGRSDASSVHDDFANDSTHLMTTTPQGECKFGWRIRNISRRVKETEALNSPLYSSQFSSGRNGYNMCLEVYLSGDGQDTHVSLYLVMLEPEHDHDLVWPFIKPVTFQLINQVDPTKSISVSFISQLWAPLHTTTKWRDGLPRFFRRHLLLSYNNFNKDDKIIIKCRINMSYSGQLITELQ